MAKVEKVGKAFIVDPNPPGMEIVPPEDLFIYVKFSAYPRSRVTYGGQTLEGNAINFNNGIEDEVHFISTKIKYDYKTGKLDPPLQKTYATTDWTNIGGFNASDTKSAGVLEGFGIKSIDIKYNSSLVPTVDITFTDVRGGALFDVIKDEDRLSPYSIFFKMPYPVFNLSVKGYFGQKVDFCLHMINWTSNFDGSTGNFDITANFLGFQQAFLNDMVLGNIIGTINTTEGYNNLNRIFDESKSEIGSSDLGGKTLEDLRNSGELNIRKIDDFFTQISKLQVQSEIIKTEINSFQFLKDLNGKLSLLKTLKSFIGNAIQKEPKSDSNGSDEKTVQSKSYLELENRIDIIDTSPIKDDELIKNKNYLSIRDYVVFNSINRASFKSYISTLNSIILKYKEYLKSDQRIKYQPNNTLESAKLKDILKTQKIKTNETVESTKDRDLIDSFFDITNEENWENYIVSPTKGVNLKPDPKRLDFILESFYTTGSEINLLKNYDKGPDINNNLNTDRLKKNISDKIYYSPKTNLLPTSNVLVADFRKQRALLEDSIIDLEEIVKIQKEIVQEEINEKLLENFRKEFNFNPTIGKCFEIIANNTQAMVETIYDISVAAEDKTKAENRKSILKTYETDVPTGIDGVAWPSIYQKGDKGDLEEIYMGDVLGINTSDFPELDFVERVFENIVGKTKTLEDVTKASVLKNGLDTDNWFPINPIDYKVNPWIKLNSLNDVQSIGNELLEKFFTRVSLLNNYTKFSPSTGLRNIDEYARLESISANKTIFSEKARKIISNLLIEIENQLNNPNTPVVAAESFNIKKCKFYNDFIIENNIGYEISEVNGYQKIGDFKISGIFSDDIEYILFDEKGIVNNNKKLFQEIKDDEIYRKLTDPNAGNIINKEVKGPELFYKNFYSGANNLTTYNSYNIWYKEVGNRILKNSNNLILGDLSKCRLEDVNPTGSTNDSLYINSTYFNKTYTGKTDYGDIMTDNDLYEGQTSNYSRALLLLSTFPFRNFKEGFLNSVFDNLVFNGARIINLPKLYVYYIGALLWRYEESLVTSDPIKKTNLNNKDYSLFITPPNCYLNRIGYRAASSTNKIDKIASEYLEDELLYLPKSVKNKLINTFKNWVDSENFNSSLTGTFEKNIKKYVPDLITQSTLTKQDKDLAKSYVHSKIKETTDLILLNPDIFDKVKIQFNKTNYKGLVVDKNSLLSYITNFKQKFNEVGKDNKNGEEGTNEFKNDKKNLTPIKLQLYNYFKNINNKWVGSEEKSFNICGDPNNKNLFDYFKFIDRGWRFIGDEATFNLKSFLTLGSNLNTSVYFFISKLLRDSNFLFQILPTYINFKNAEEVGKIFQPQTVLQNNESTGPIFCCIYIGGASERLDIGERSNYYFKDDGFSLTTGEIPADLTDTNKALIDNNGNIGIDETSLVAFRVSFGAQNQTVFKNLSLSQQEHRETGEYFSALSDIIDKRGGTQKTYVGTDLLRLFKARSYTCKVDAMGCMNIQPLMYFDLQNVPFFNGAYLITSVSHSISPNEMSTSFDGVRQSRFKTSPTKEITADLDIDLNESSETPKIEFTNLNNKNELFSIGVLNPNDKFDFDINFNGQSGIDKFKNIGVTSFTDENLRNLIDYFRINLESEKIVTNSQVTMALSAIFSNSENLLSTEMKWDAENKETYIRRFPENDINNGKIKYYGITTSNEKYLKVQPIFTAGTIDDISYLLPGNDDLKEFLINDRIENRKKEINDKLPNLDVNNATEKTEKEKLEKELKKLNDQEANLSATTKYYNIFEGDAYRFRPRGYLYMVGRKQYTDIYSDLGQIDPKQFSKTPEQAFFTSLKIWKYLKENSKSAYDYSSLNSGSATIYKKCIDITHQYNGKGIEVVFSTFEKVLTIFTDKNGNPLINYFNP